MSKEIHNEDYIHDMLMTLEYQKEMYYNKEYYGRDTE